MKSPLPPLNYRTVTSAIFGNTCPKRRFADPAHHHFPEVVSNAGGGAWTPHLSFACADPDYRSNADTGHAVIEA